MRTRSISEDISLDLSGNAVDSIKHSIDLIAWPEDADEVRRLKQAILSISHGVELLLKERLRRVHPSLVWENVDKYGSLEARTVGTEQALVRLKKIGGVELSVQDVALVRSLRNTRNAIEHFTWTTTRREATAIVGRGLSFALHFAEQHLGLAIFGYETRKDDTFSMLLENNYEFAKAHVERHEQKLSTLGEYFRCCDFCNALGVPAGGGACTFCGHWHAFEDTEDDIPF